MPREIQTLRQFKERLDTFLAEWNTFGAVYDDEQSVFDLGADGRPDLSETAYYLYFPSFADAWDNTATQARTLFLRDFTAWAADVIEALGIEKFSTDIGDPPYSDCPWESHRESLEQFLTGTSDIVEAGSRIIFWAGAYRIPSTCRRSGDGALLHRWIHHLIQFGVGRCRTLSEPFSWVNQSLEGLWNHKRKGKKPTFHGDGEKSVGHLIRLWKKHGKKITSRLLAKMIGSSPALVCGTSSWKEYRQEFKTEKKPRAVRMTRVLEEVLGENDIALAGLVEEQEKDSRQYQSNVYPKKHRGRRPKV